MDPPESPPPPRRFSLGDGLILMAVLAFALSLLRSNEWFARIPGRLRFWGDALPRVVGVSPGFLAWGSYARLILAQILEELLQLLGPVLMGLTLVQPLMRLRRPRPPWRELVRQPGFVACLGVIAAGLIIIDLGWVARIDVSRGVIWASAAGLLWPILGWPPWRSEASWIDRLGRAVGWGWIVATAAGTALTDLL